MKLHGAGKLCSAAHKHPVKNGGPFYKGLHMKNNCGKGFFPSSHPKGWEKWVYCF